MHFRILPGISGSGGLKEKSDKVSCLECNMDSSIYVHGVEFDWIASQLVNDAKAKFITLAILVQ
jgi:hypothetical protein